MITNPKRRKQIKEFLDNGSPEMSRYYDLIDNSKISDSKVKSEMRKLIQSNPDFYEPYLFLADTIKSEGKEKEAREIIFIAYQRAVRRIVDKEGNFPKKIEWSWVENRHLVRAIESWAFEQWEQNKNEEALEIFRKLLKSNPNDNIGARYDILALRLGLSSDFEQMFVLKDNPNYLDTNKEIDWFYDNWEKFPEEFEWWKKAVKWKR